MNGHFRFSGSNFLRMEELEVRASAFSVALDFPKHSLLSLACFSKPRNSLRSGAPSEIAPTLQSAFCSEQKTRLSLPSNRTRNAFVREFRCGHPPARWREQKRERAAS